VAYDLLQCIGMKTFVAAVSLVTTVLVSASSFAGAVPVNGHPDMAVQKSAAHALARLGPAPIRSVSGKTRTVPVGTKHFGVTWTRTASDDAKQTTTRFALGPWSVTTTKTRLTGKAYEARKRHEGASTEKQTTVVGPLRTKETTRVRDVQNEPAATHTRQTEIIRVDNGPGRGQVTAATVSHSTREKGGANIASAEASASYSRPGSTRTR
jgi:hypothetical protein